MKRFHFLLVWVVLCTCVNLARAIDVFPVFTLDSGLSNATVNIEINGSNSSDFTSLGGTINSVLSLDKSAATPRIAGLNFNGGRIHANEGMDFDLTIFSVFNIHIDADFVAGQVTTPAPPAPMNSLAFGDLNYAFDAAHHLTSFNEGTLVVSGASNSTINLAVSPLSGSTPGGTNGFINLFQGATRGNLTDFNAQLTLPIQFSNTIPQDTPFGPVDVNVQTTGQIVANSLFSVDIGLAESPGGGPILLPSDPILAVDLDGDSFYPGVEPPQNAIDGTGAKYLNNGKVNSGFIVSPGAGSSVVKSFQLTTANDVIDRDPSSWELYGTNDAITSTDNSTGTNENWTLLDSGPVSLPQARNTAGPLMAVDNNDTYSSYYMVFKGLKAAGAAEAMQIGEVQLFGNAGIVGKPSIFLPGDSIIAIDTDGNSSYPVAGAPNGPEPPAHAIDGTLAKHLNHGEVNSGFIATPSTGGSIVTDFRVTTANDESPRDPTSWQLYGTKDPITSSDNSTGSNENWTLIDSGSIALPGARNTIGPTVSVNNDEVYTSYRMVFTGVKDEVVGDAMQIAEIEFFGDIGIHDTPGLLASSDPIIAIDTDGNSEYFVEEPVTNAIDNTFNKYLNFGDVNSGFIVTPEAGTSVIESFQVTTANDAENRDPSFWRLFGTNDTVTSADNSTGSSENWTLINAGALSLPVGRNTLGPLLTVGNSTTPYSSYKMVFTELKGGLPAGEMQIGEIEFFGGVIQEATALLAPSDPIIAIDSDGNSSYLAGESVANAIDGTLDKYLNFGQDNSGFIVTPAAGATSVESFQIITANDFEERDPTSWQLFGTNDAITSADNSTGTDESWTLIDVGSILLPTSRDTYAPLVTVADGTVAYLSYKMIFTDLKDSGVANSMQIAEIQFYGELIGLRGDFDQDGDVDATDFLTWQRGLGTTYDASDFVDWQNNYGGVASPVTSASTVPEPGSIALVLSMALLITVSPACSARMPS